MTDSEKLKALVELILQRPGTPAEAAARVWCGQGGGGVTAESVVRWAERFGEQVPIREAKPPMRFVVRL